MNNKFLKMAVAGLVLSVSGFANAGLISGTTSDTSIDTVTGFEWLDFSFTAGMSYNSVLSSHFVVSEGYEIATFDQVKDLWANTGRFTNVDAAANSILTNMGCMSYLIGHSCDQVGEEWTGAFYNSSIATHNLMLVDTTNGTQGLFLEYWLSNIDKNISVRNDIAAYLVRTAPQQQVPEPSTIAILSLGLMGLAARRFKKQA